MLVQGYDLDYFVSEDEKVDAEGDAELGLGVFVVVKGTVGGVVGEAKGYAVMNIRGYKKYKEKVARESTRGNMGAE